MDNKLIKELTKCIVYTGCGVGIGFVLGSQMEVVYKVIISLCILCGLILLGMVINLFMGNSDAYATKTRTSYSSLSSGSSSNLAKARTSYSNTGVKSDNARIDSARTGSASSYPQTSFSSNAENDNRIQTNQKPRKEAVRVPAKRVVLINEEGSSLLSWSLQNTTSLIIGKSTDKEPVDIDLSGSAVAQMISKQHAVLNYTENGWYIDDIDSKNGTRVKKASQNAIMDIKLVGAVEVEPGDLIYIANAMLQIQ